MEWDWDWEIVDGLSDFMDEGAFCFVLGGILRILLFVFKLLLFGGYYALPVILVVAGFALGGNLGDATGASVYEKFEEKQIDELTHTVTIYTDDSKYTIYVREDQPWTVQGSMGEYNAPYEYDEADGYPSGGSDYVENSAVYDYDKTFIGLFDGPSGEGNCYANAKGYGLIDIKKDIKLYAVYE